jgi:hypothetical protein
LAFADTTWYANAGDQSTTGHYAVAKFTASGIYSAGQLVRQLTAPTVGNERVFVVIVAGTASTEPAWTVTRGAKNTSGTVTFQECTGASAVNGDLTNTPTWSGFRAISTAVTLGAIIQRNNGASYWICSTAGSVGASEPAWANNTAGTTQVDSTVTWTCLGVVGNFTGGQAPHARLNNVFGTNWFVAGNTVYVGDNHAESQGATLISSPGGSTLPSKILCHNHSGSYPPSSLVTGAVVATAGAFNISLTLGGTFYIYGVAFRSGVGAAAAASLTLQTGNGWVVLDNCLLECASTGSSTMTIGGGSVGVCLLNNTQMKFGNVADVVNFTTNGTWVWQNTAPAIASGSSTPTTLLQPQGGQVLFEALDLSALTGTVVGTGSGSNFNVSLKDCKLNASATFSTPGATGVTIQLIRCDSGATGYKSARYQYDGVETTETSITRVGGASDPTGQAQSRKIVTTANSQWLRPFKAEPYAIWNPTTGANVTVTVYGTVNAGALPNNDDIWLEIEYLGSATSPLGTMVTTTKASVLASNAAVASDGSTWNGGGSGAGWTPFKLVATLSSPQPGLAGYLHARVRAAKPSTTYYLDPKVQLS